MKRAKESDFESDDDLDREIDEIANVIAAESKPSISGAQATLAKPLSKRARQSESDFGDDLDREIDDVVAAKSKLSTSGVQAALAKPLFATGSSTLQLSSSHVKRSNQIVCDSDDDLDRDIDEIADAMAAESRPSPSGAAQPTLSDMMDLLQQILTCLHQILPRLNRIEQDIKEIKEHQTRAH
uniref:Uncharacterized protein n=1 Tax=Quercus lobata TaxID=97700 RepID=A0A7N2N6N4_QUELO